MLKGKLKKFQYPGFHLPTPFPFLHLSLTVNKPDADFLFIFYQNPALYREKKNLLFFNNGQLAELAALTPGSLGGYVNPRGKFTLSFEYLNEMAITFNFQSNEPPSDVNMISPSL